MHWPFSEVSSMNKYLQNMFQNPQQSMVSFYYAGKLLIQFVLFFLFLIFFGLPSYHRYHQKGVLVKTEKTSMQGLELPAVTICPRCFSLSQKISHMCNT